MKSELYINGLSFCCSLGSEPAQLLNHLQQEDPERLISWHEPLFSGRTTNVFSVGDLLSPIDKEGIAKNRNNQIAEKLVNDLSVEIEKVKKHFRASRIGVVVGSTTTGIEETESQFAELSLDEKLPKGYDFRHQLMGDVAETVRKLAGVTGPTYTVSTACTSSARAFISASTLVNSGLCDAVICGGIDSLCHLTVNGFDALEQVTTSRCRPFDKRRDGINIGEGGALFVLSKRPANVALTGWGESSDAYHLSSPLPCGSGALAAMSAALESANLVATDIQYINAHGTGTSLNDAMESKAIHSLFGDNVPVSSTKALTGHCLGAAGAIEAAISCLLLENPHWELPPQRPSLHQFDDELAPLMLVSQEQAQNGNAIMSNSFAFGGNNASLIFQRTSSL